MAIKLRRGLEIDRMPIVFAQGEIIYVIDTKKVYIGDGVTFGGNLVTGEELLTALDDVQISSLANNNLLSYNSSLSKWQNKAVTTTDISEGTNQYFTESRVRAVILTGLSLVTNAVISATDSVLIAFGKLQAQITANLSTLTSHTSNTSNPHATTKAQVGLGNADNTSDANKPISTATQTALNAKQATLVSGTNIKTINGTSVLGSGDIVTSVQLSYRHDFNVYDYLGKAASGSSESASVWTITRLTIASDGTATVGTATNVTWTGRYTHIYT